MISSANSATKEKEHNGGIATETTPFLPTTTHNNSNSNNESFLAEEHHRDNNQLLRLVLTAGATAATLGYDVGIMADCIIPLQKDLDLTGFQVEVALGSLNFLAALGALLAGNIADTQGRKVTVQWCAWLFVIGTIIMTGALNYSMLLIGRIITGLGVGVSFLVAPIYITEVAPPDRRGELNTVFDLAINGGILAGYVVGFLVHLVSPGNWRLMLGIGLALPIAVLIVLARLPESPRWFMMIGQRDDAIQALMQLGCQSHQEADTMAQDMQTELHDETHRSVLWGPNHKLAIGFGFFQQIAGSEAILYYSSDFLKQAGMTSPVRRLFGNCMVGLCKLVPEIYAMQFVDKLGRRSLMLASAVLRVVTLALLSLGFYFQAPGLIMLVFLCSVVASFSTGLGPFTFLCASENLGSRERSTGMVYCTVANRLTSGTVAVTVVTLTRIMGDANLFGMYTVLATVSLAFYWNMTETAGKTLEEIQNSASHKPALLPL